MTTSPTPKVDYMNYYYDPDPHACSFNKIRLNCIPYLSPEKMLFLAKSVLEKIVTIPESYIGE